MVLENPHNDDLHPNLEIGVVIWARKIHMNGDVLSPASGILW